jgi:hypothetical protein
MEDVLRVLKAASTECASESVVYAHRTIPNCFLGRDLIVWLAKCDKSLLSLVMGCAPSPMSRRASASKASKVLDAINVFLHRCLEMRFLVGVNKDEKQVLGDCFYVMRLDGSEEERSAGLEMDKTLLECVDLLKRKVEVKDRRMGFRSVRGFLAAEAKAVLGERGVMLFESLVRENLVALTSSGYNEIFHFVPRVVHSGFVNVSTAGATFVRRWVVLREKSVIVFAENRKLIQSEIELTMATCEADVLNSTEHEHRFVLTTATERIVMMTSSSYERDVWLNLIRPLNTVISEENELINQAEAIITSCSFYLHQY